MTYFLLVYDRAAGTLRSLDAFANASEALRARFAAERENHDRQNIEIVAMTAGSEDELRTTGAQLGDVSRREPAHTRFRRLNSTTKPASRRSRDGHDHLEIEATAPDGFDEARVRTVSENATTLKFEQSGFEER